MQTNALEYKDSINKWARIAFLLIFLFSPNDVFKLTSIYHSETLSNIAYKWLDYDFSWLFLVLIVVALPCLGRRNNFLIFSVLIFLRSIVYYFAGKDNVFTFRSFELQLSFLCGWMLFCVGKKWRESFFESDDFSLFELFVLIHFATQIIGMLAHISGFSGRYNAVNLDVETTGFLYSIYILLEQEYKGKNGVKSYLAFAGLLLTGARIPLLLLVIILAIQKFKAYFQNMRAHKIQVSSLVELLLLILLFAFLVTGGFARLGEKMSSITRLADLVAGVQESSVAGRIRSLDAGLNILRENYWGLDYSYVILQKYTMAQGFPTFPHSQILIWRIILGPILFWVGVAMVLLRLRLCVRNGYGRMLPLTYFIVYLLATGGPLANYKQIFIYIWVIALCMLIQRGGKRDSSTLTAV